MEDPEKNRGKNKNKLEMLEELRGAPRGPVCGAGALKPGTEPRPTCLLSDSVTNLLRSKLINVAFSSVQKLKF
jgi:hypothetical protein